MPKKAAALDIKSVREIRNGRKIRINKMVFDITGSDETGEEFSLTHTKRNYGDYLKNCNAATDGLNYDAYPVYSDYFTHIRNSEGIALFNRRDLISLIETRKFVIW